MVFRHQRFLGRKLQTGLPVYPSQLIPKWPDLQIVRQRDEADQQQQQVDYNRRHAARHLPKLADGDRVFIRDTNMTREGVVQRSTDMPRSYIVDTPSGPLRRNRRCLVKNPSGDGNLLDVAADKQFEELYDPPHRSLVSGSENSNQTVPSETENRVVLRRSSRISKPP